MASKKLVPKAKSKLLATLLTGDRQPCAFCQRNEDDETIYGKLYAIGDIQVHYFCTLLSCCLIQRGKDSEGLFGFLYPDIVAEVERSKKHKCSYCHVEGASLGCSVSQCRKQFHLPCGREKNAISLFYGNYKSFCQQHAPRQKIPEHIMALVRLRMKVVKKALKEPNSSGLEVLSAERSDDPSASLTESVCVICYEPVCGFPAPDTFWPPCCARDEWFHRACVQRMALSAGMHFLKCPLCNNKDQFYWSVVNQGIYVPDRDAAWELEQGAFAEIYERPAACSAPQCLCVHGRSRNDDKGDWDIQMCLLCGMSGCHVGCARGRFVCPACRHCAPKDLTALQDKIDKLIQLEEKERVARTLRPVMPSRMSLRRTKPGNIAIASTSQLNFAGNRNSHTELKDSHTRSATSAARLELNLRSPRIQPQNTTEHSRTDANILQTIENTMFSPTKLVEERLNRRIECLGVKDVSPAEVINKVKEILLKPRPLCVKKRIVDSVLDQILLDMLSEKSNGDNGDISKEVSNENGRNDEDTSRMNDDKNTDGLTEGDDSSRSTFQLPSEFIADRSTDDSLPLIETPKKLTTVDIQKDSSLEISENNEVVKIDVVKIEESSDSKDFMKGIKLKIPEKTKKCAFKFSQSDKEALVENNLNMDLDSFKNFYLNEVDREVERDFQCAFNHKHTNKSGQKAKLRSAIDFAIEATKSKEEKRKKLKRKLQGIDGVTKKKPKDDKEIVLKCNKDNSSNIKVVCSNDNENITESINLSVNKPKTKKRLKKIKKNERRKENVSSTIDFTVETDNTKKRLKNIKNKKKHRENIQVKIRFRKAQVRLKITKSETKIKKKKFKKIKKPEPPKILKQCILQYGTNCSPNQIIVRPEHDVTPKKRNYVRLEKSPDALVQTTIQNFFKIVPTKAS